MRIAERMGLVYTALFLMVSVALITQNSDRLMAKFRGYDNVMAVEDIYTVQAGRAQRLFVLRNDVLAAQVRPQMIRLLTQPNCGTVRQIGGSFIYENSAACSDRQEFSYCLDTGAECRPARVMLRVIEPRDPVATIETGPITDLAGLDRQAGINRQDLEISNVHLGRVMPKERGSVRMRPPEGGMKLAAVAADPLPRIALAAPLTGGAPRPQAASDTTDIAGRGDAAGQAEAAAAPRSSPRDPGLRLAEVAPAAPVEAILSDADPAPLTGSSGAPPPAQPPVRPSALPPDTAGAARIAALPADPGARPAALARIPSAVLPEDPGGAASALKTQSGLDRNPFGTGPCQARLTLRPDPGGMIALELDAPCNPNQRVEIGHGLLRMAYATDHTGRLRLRLPAVERRAHVALRLEDGTSLRASVSVPELDGIERTAIMWQGAAEIDLHALEHGAAPGSDGDVWRGNPRSPDAARRLGGGYMTVLGDPAVERPLRAQVYTLPLSAAARGRVGFALTATASPAACGRPVVVRSLRSTAGRMVAATGLRMVLPDCDSPERSIVLKNVLADVIIAGN